MTALSPRSDLPEETGHKLAELRRLIVSRQVATTLRSNLLSAEERRRVPLTPDGLARLPELFANCRGFSLERATLELALHGSLLIYGDYLLLRQQIREPLGKTDSAPRPDWDSDTGKLSFQGVVVRKVGARAKNVRCVLGAFQKKNWPNRIDIPLRATRKSSKSKVVRNALSNLNRQLSALKFHGDGTGKGICWEDCSE